MAGSGKGIASNATSDQGTTDTDVPSDSEMHQQLPEELTMAGL
jgi:hypothetical protein